LANTDFTFVIASSGEMADAMAFQWTSGVELNSRSKPMPSFYDAD
jgi:hypothetical protein